MRLRVIGGILILLTFLVPLNASAETIFQLDTPKDGQTVFGLVEVSGYVLDSGEECGPIWTWNRCIWPDQPVQRIDLFVNNVFVATADLNQPRYDILQAYPWYAGTPYEQPGFFTSFDSRVLPNGTNSLFLRVTFEDTTIQDYGQTMFIVNNTVNPPPFGELELPGPNQPMNGVFPVTGWALDDGSTDDMTVEILVDGLVVGHANMGIHRPDIKHRFPSHPDAQYAGFVRMLNTTVLNNGVHSISVRVTDSEGGSRVIGRRFVQTFNTGYNLPPFGGIDWPISNHIMYAKGCGFDPDDPPISLPEIPGLYEDPQVVEMVMGWALDVGSRTDAGGVAYVQLMIDGSIVQDTYEPIRYNWYNWYASEGTDVNVYGLARMDIQRLFPDVPNSKNSGWIFIMDLTDLMVRQGYREGLHYIKIRAGDLENNVADIAQVPVIFDCDNDPDRPSFGDIYTPAHMERVAETVEVTGWAIDHDRIDEMEVWVDGDFIDYVDEFNLLSPEVEDLLPWLPSYITEDAGYTYSMDTTQFTDGEHILVIWTEDRWGRRNIVGERRFVIDNLSPPNP
jgi:N-acetylmuramoyl-L-alanine amidase